MKILIIMGGFFPGKKFGGPPVSIDNFCSIMKNDDCYIITKNHDLNDDKQFEDINDGWNNRGNCRVLYLSDSEYKKSSFERELLELHPDIVYLQGLFQSCVVPCLTLARKYKIRVLLAPRGELCDGAIKIKKYKKVPYIFALRCFGLVKRIHWQSTSEEEYRAIKQRMKVADKYIHRLVNIPSVPRIDFSRNDKTSGEGRFVFLSRLHPKKNLLFAISLFQQVKGKAVLDIYGSIEDEVYWNECQKIIDKLPTNVEVHYKGLVDHEMVHSILSQYDAMVFPTQSENYGHVIAESLAVDTPVIISKNTPWTDVNEYSAGWAIDLDNRDIYVSVIESIISMDEVSYSQIRSNVRRYYRSVTNINMIKEEYDKEIKSIIEIE